MGSPGWIIGLVSVTSTTGIMFAYFVNHKSGLLLYMNSHLVFRVVGIGLHQANSENVWRVPFGLQLVPAGLMCLGLFTVKVSYYCQVPRVMLTQIGIIVLVDIQGTYAGGYHESCLLLK